MGLASKLAAAQGGAPGGAPGGGYSGAPPPNQYGAPGQQQQQQSSYPGQQQYQAYPSYPGQQSGYQQQQQPPYPSQNSPYPPQNSPYPPQNTYQSGPGGYNQPPSQQQQGGYGQGGYNRPPPAPPGQSQYNRPAPPPPDPQQSYGNYGAPPAPQYGGAPQYGQYQNQPPYSGYGAYGGQSQGPPQGQYQQQPPQGGQQQQYGGGAPPAQGGNVGQFRNLLQQQIREKRLENFYPQNSPAVDQLAQKAAAQIGGLCQRWRIPTEVGNDLAKLGLYDVIIYIDDSGSMQFEENGERIKDLQLILQRAASVSTMFDEDGIQLRFMNADYPAQMVDGVRSEQQVDQLMRQVQFKGLTPMGTALRQKVIDGIVMPKIQQRRYTKPTLIMAITDGQPAGEPQNAIFDTIKYAANAVGQQYGPGGIAFQVAQVGNDLKAREFLAKLDEDPVVGNLIDCTSNFENESDEMKRQGVDLTPELWLVKLLLGAIDSSYDRKDEKGGNAPPPPPPPPQGGYGGPPQQNYGAPQGGYQQGPPGGYQQGGYQQGPPGGYQQQQGGYGGPPQGQQGMGRGGYGPPQGQGQGGYGAPPPPRY